MLHAAVLLTSVCLIYKLLAKHKISVRFIL